MSKPYKPFTCYCDDESLEYEYSYWRTHIADIIFISLYFSMVFILLLFYCAQLDYEDFIAICLICFGVFYLISGKESFRLDKHGIMFYKTSFFHSTEQFIPLKKICFFGLISQNPYNFVKLSAKDGQFLCLAKEKEKYKFHDWLTKEGNALLARLKADDPEYIRKLQTWNFLSEPSEQTIYCDDFPQNDDRLETPNALNNNRQNAGSEAQTWDFLADQSDKAIPCDDFAQSDDGEEARSERNRER